MRSITHPGSGRKQGAISHSQEHSPRIPVCPGFFPFPTESPAPGRPFRLEQPPWVERVQALSPVICQQQTRGPQVPAPHPGFRLRFFPKASSVSHPHSPAPPAPQQVTLVAWGGSLNLPLVATVWGPYFKVLVLTAF